jgi:hypothetical protein
MCYGNGYEECIHINITWDQAVWLKTFQIEMFLDTLDYIKYKAFINKEFDIDFIGRPKTSQITQP